MDLQAALAADRECAGGVRTGSRPGLRANSARLPGTRWPWP